MVTHEIPKRWKQIWIKPWWIDSFKNLAYVNEPFNDPESLARWQALGYTQTKFTGDMYDMRNQEPEWLSQFRQYFDWEHFSWSVYCMEPGTVLPNHQDTYSKFKQIYNVTDADSIHRAIVFLDNWESGHYLEIDGTPITNWVAGDVIIWQSDVWHLAANCGMTNRYTLQITGVPRENTFV